MNDKGPDIESILVEALTRHDAEDRRAYLEATCGTGTELRAEIDSLLRAYDDKRSLLEVPSDLLAEPAARLTESPGTLIGKYKLLEKIGEGGMAVVYMAEQEEHIRRKVALKIIKLGMDTRAVIARFEAERQALAMMDHPNIARVLDAGATETGRPYFVMELVQGVSITDYCDANSLSTNERLKLFTEVCNAVQHAHQKGIIHRDIKPSNVMVTHHDGKPIPKVIDFGIAKATRQKLTEKTLFTRYANIIGTPAYMSPEQAELSDLDIDTRTDIYSLGVLLYELLTGTPPFGEEELRRAGYIEMQRIIREQEPLRPSTKLSTLGGTLTDIAKHRNATPDVLTKTIRGDLDWIALKALEKDRTRRYETANGLASDIRRHLEHEPVLARGPGTTYRMGKFLRRHRSQTIAVLALAIITGAMATVLSMWNRDRLQLTEAEGFRHRGILSQAREQVARLDYAVALKTVKPVLRSKHVGAEAQLLYAGILVEGRQPDEAVIMLKKLLDERPVIAGAAHSLLARILYESESLGTEKLKEIEKHRQKAEALLPKIAEAYFLRAMFAVTVKEQFATLDEALRLDSQHYESRRLRAYTYYASRKYEEMEHDALVMTILRPLDPLGYSLRAIALRELGKHAGAITEYDNALACPRKTDAQDVDLSTQRCETLLRMGDYKRIIADAGECLKLWPDKPVFQYHIFSALTALGDYEKADGVFREIVSQSATARNELREWCAKYVFDALEAGRSWHLPEREPEGIAFLTMLEAEQTYHHLAARARRLIVDGFTPRWSPDGKKLAFSTGFHGYSGVGLYDMDTAETELLIVPGKDPAWSPDGKYIAFVRDRQALGLQELATAERKYQRRPVADEEVWIMKSDGTEPTRLARGSWPSWGSDSQHIYYQAREEGILYSVSLAGQDTEPKRIMKCSSRLSSVSPDEKYVAIVEDSTVKIVELASSSEVSVWTSPAKMWGCAGWSSTGEELCLGAFQLPEAGMGVWIYNLGQGQAAKVLDGRISAVSWRLDGTKFAFNIAQPYYEIWVADLDPNISTVEALGPGRTLEGHYQEMIDFYSRRIEADPYDASNYSKRAQCHDYLDDKAKANADMRRWSAVANGKSPSDFQAGTPQNIRRIINMPFNCQIVFSAERPVNGNPVLNVAFGQKPSGSFVQPGCDSSTKTAKKGRCKMKSFQIPMLSTSLLGLCLLSGLDSPPARADFTFGDPVNIESTIPVLDWSDSIECFSYDGLEMYLNSARREGGSGDADLWVSRRISTEENWGPPENLGPAVNSSKIDVGASISADGLTLYFYSDRGRQWPDIYMTTRPTRDAAWEPAVSLGTKVNDPVAGDHGPSISQDGLELYFSSSRSGGHGRSDLYVLRRTATNDPWADPVNLGPVVNSPYYEGFPSLSPDGLLLFFSENFQWGDPPRPGGYGGCDIWVTRRTTTSDSWQEPVNLGPRINHSGHEMLPRISPDGRKLYFWDFRDDTYTNWQASIDPTCDFNVDGIVDTGDVRIMIEHWLTDYPLCDIGPMPWGDGIVDVQDLIVLAEHLFEESQ